MLQFVPLLVFFVVYFAKYLGGGNAVFVCVCVCVCVCMYTDDLKNCKQISSENICVHV